MNIPEIAHKTAPSEPGRRGRRPKDLVYKLRAWVWLNEILSRTDASLRGLDRELLGDQHEGLRAFWRIHRDGFDPGRTRTSLGKESLVTVVAAQPGYRDTKEIYDSPLWCDVLGPAEISAERRDALIAELLRDLRLFQADGSDEFVSTEMKLALPALHACSQDGFRVQLDKLIGRRDIKCILLQCLLFRRAMANAHLEEALCLRDAIFFSVKHYCDRPGFDGRTLGVFQHLVNRRVFCGARDIKPTQRSIDFAKEMVSGWRSKATTRRAHRAADMMEFLCSIDFSLFDKRTLYAIYDLDAEIKTYVEQRPTLHKAAVRKSRKRMRRNTEKYLKEQTMTYDADA